MLDLLELLEVFLSWRLYVGWALTGVLCVALGEVIPNETARLVVLIPIGAAGFVLAFYWQIKAETDS